ncbi:MAG: DUF493 family protein [Bacteroidota bacterium]
MDADFRRTLHFRLKDSHDFPATYTFKFIVKSDKEKLDFLRGLFDKSAEITFKESSKSSYTSITIRVEMESAEAVIQKYEAAASVEGIISL